METDNIRLPGTSSQCKFQYSFVITSHSNLTIYATVFIVTG